MVLTSRPALQRELVFTSSTHAERTNLRKKRLISILITWSPFPGIRRIYLARGERSKQQSGQRFPQRPKWRIEFHAGRPPLGHHQLHSARRLCGHGERYSRQPPELE